MVSTPFPPYLDPEFLGAATCRRVRAAMSQGVAEAAAVLDPDIVLDREARRATSIEVDAVTLAIIEEALDAARAAVGAHFGLTIAGREGPGFLRYAPGGFYRSHRDRAVDADWPGASQRLIALVVFLNSARGGSEDGDFTGGNLVMFSEPPDAGGRGAVTVTPREGTLVAFLADRLHEVRPVAGGLRDVIVDWYY